MSHYGFGLGIWGLLAFFILCYICWYLHKDDKI